MMARRTLSLFFVVFVAATAYLPAQKATTQAATAHAAVMPTDPTELMRMAVQVNGLDAPDMKPWHLVTTYQTFDEQGKPKDRGTFEEWWAGPDRFKLSYKSSGFNQVEYRNEKGTFLAGDRKWAPMPESLIVQNIGSPLQADTKPPYYRTEGRVGNVLLQCLRQGSNSVAEKMPYPVYCFAQDIPAIRLTIPCDGMISSFNNIVRFRGQYLAQQVQVTENKHPLLNIDISSLDALDKINDADLAVPTEASAAGQLWLPYKIMKDRKLAGGLEYPPSARSSHIQGVVEVAVTISKDGKVTDTQPMSGPPELQRAATASIKTWSYRPYLLNGEPVEVKTQIDVTFALGWN
jgi:TonB family protein